MKKDVISPSQLFAMILLFELGTALVVPIGLESQRSVWLSILIALPGGVLFFSMYGYLHRQFPNLIISAITRKILGRWIALPVNLLFISLFMFNGSRNLREAGSLLVAASYDKTPILIINLIMLLAVVYVLNKGLEVLGRMAEIYMIVMISMGVSLNFIVIASGLVDLKNLFPLHLKDWEQAFRSAYPNIWIFPYLELIVMTTILPYLGKGTKVNRTGIFAIVLSGLLLSITHAIEISVLGEDIYGRATFPLFTTVSLVNVADFIQRLDAFVFLTLIIGVFFKLTLYCYSAMAIAGEIFNVRDTRKLALPIGVVVLFLSLLSAESYPEHIAEGKAFQVIFIPLAAAAVPLVLFIVHLIRKKSKLYKS